MRQYEIRVSTPDPNGDIHSVTAMVPTDKFLDIASALGPEGALRIVKRRVALAMQKDFVEQLFHNVRQGKIYGIR